MRPRLFPILVLCWLACSVALAGLFLGSWGRELFVRYTDASGPWTAIARCEDGVAVGIWWTSAGPGAPGLDGGVLTLPYGTRRIGGRLISATIGFEVRQGAIGRGVSTEVRVPLWPAILLTALPPAAWGWRRRRQGVRGFEVEMAAERAGETGL